MRPSTGLMVFCRSVTVVSSQMILDDFKITAKFPIGHGTTELALFPLACRGVMLDECIAKEIASRCGCGESLGCIPQRTWQTALRRMLAIVGVADDRRI